ncbi:MAG: Autotransporter beta-domain protein [Puniceicoccaceae bacterium 5H]|nr:MAG: Autotransporter beta-domain protein [Puniceicoccaceae bacterium 5H]
MKLTFSSLLLLTVGLVAPCSAALLLEDLCPGPGGPFISSPRDISFDGSTIVGYSVAGRYHRAVRAVNGTDCAYLTGDYPPGYDYHEAYGVSDDARGIVGTFWSGGRNPAFYWREETGFVDLGDLADPRQYYWAFAASNNRTVIGWASGEMPSSSSGSTVAFKWTPATGMTALGTTPAYANDISSHGTVIVGQNLLTRTACYWNAAGEMIDLGVLPGYTRSIAQGVSADGTTIVGECSGPGGRTAFRWTAATGMLALTDITGGLETHLAYETSYNGNIVAGAAMTPEGETVFVWDVLHGVRDLKDVLVDAGYDAEDWVLSELWSISADGSTLAFTADTQNGWRTYALSGYTIPEPRTYALVVGLSALGLLRWRRKCHSNRITLPPLLS